MRELGSVPLIPFALLLSLGLGACAQASSPLSQRTDEINENDGRANDPSDTHDDHEDDDEEPGEPVAGARATAPAGAGSDSASSAAGS